MQVITVIALIFLIFINTGEANDPMVGSMMRHYFKYEPCRTFSTVNRHTELKKCAVNSTYILEHYDSFHELYVTIPLKLNHIIRIFRDLVVNKNNCSHTVSNKIMHNNSG